MHTKPRCSFRKLDFHFWRVWQEAVSREEVAGGVQKRGRRDQAGPGAEAEGAAPRARAGANRDFKWPHQVRQHSHSVGIEGDSAPTVTAQPDGDWRVGSRG